MSATRIPHWTAVAGVATALSALGCTNLHQAGSLVGINRQITAKAAVADQAPELPPLPTPEPAVGGEAYGYFAEPGCEAAPRFQEPNCAAPFLREPTCGAPVFPEEPTCAAPQRPPCQQPPCPCVKHEHVEAPPEQELPQPQGCLAFGGGHVSIPLPTIQFPGLFRVPAFRSALIPVAEPTFVGVAAAPVAPAVTERVIEEVAVAREAVIVEERALVEEEVIEIDQETLRRLLAESAARNRSNRAAEPASECLCDEELEKVRQLIRSLQAKKDCDDSDANEPTPAAAPEAQQEIDALRSEVQEYQREIDALIEDLKAREGQK